MARITRIDIGQCKDCKWWDCRPINFIFGYCQKIKLNTDKDFGCIHWESK